MGKNTDTGSDLDAFTKALAELDTDGFVEVERAHGRRPRQHRTAPAPEGGGEKAPEGGRGDGESAAPVAEKERTAKTALALIRRLAKRPDRFKEYEHALWDNVDVLVPSVMSMDAFTKSVQALRESNTSHERASGTSSDDPLREIRKFLAGAEKEGA